MSIRLRLTAWYSAILAVTLIIFGSIVYGVVYYNTYNEVEKRIDQQIKRIDPSITLDPFTGTVGFTFKKTVSNFDETQIIAQIHDYTTGVNILDQNLKRMSIEIPVPSISPEKMVKSISRIQIDGNPFLIYQAPIPAYNGGPIIGLLQVAAHTLPEQNLLDGLQNILVLGSAIMIIIASSLGLFLAHKSIRPIGKVIEAANQIQKGADLSVRIEYNGPQDEIGQLIGTVNNMLSRMNGFYKELEDAYAAQRRFVSDASHELRTPLTTIRGNVDLLQKMWDKESGERPSMDEETLQIVSREALSDISDEAKRMSQLVSDMLSLARADTGQTFMKSPVPLEPLVEEVVRRAQFLPHQAEWIIGNLSTLNGVYVFGNKDYLQQMLFIFIENAFKYTPEGQVSLDAFRYQNQIGLRIADTGIGMEKEDVPLIFERFYRADQSRGVTEGIGLGLSIAKWIIEEMDGSIEVVTRVDEGTTFIIWLPMIFPVPLE
ncbi:sensor histidine kinase [Paenibacillus antarcticus]|uniref:histidine kinase n=1 Tax=Paenibacillus antarcticus TaxID=253703 RepID=A0A162MFQ3_9BACL|nr:HAMP domain-containing sensor histidine kinase [Paenibacillus antarcticus]OAB48225.1 two-component sensor histidine kinase [Paenibacillus antarcticus]